MPVKLYCSDITPQDHCPSSCEAQVQWPLLYPGALETSHDSSSFSLYYTHYTYDEESDHSNKAVRKTPEIEIGHKVSEEVK